MSRVIEMSIDRGLDALPEPNLPVRISDALLPEAKAWYDRLAPQDQKAYEVALHTIDRMGALRAKLLAVPSEHDSPTDENRFSPKTIPERTETNLHHVHEILTMASEYAASYPSLAHEINFETVQKLAIVHDAGEVGAGDQPPVGLTPEQQRRKAFEVRFALRMMDRIPDAQAKEEAKELYERYTKKAPDDLEVQMTQWLDKVQGTLSIARAAAPFLNHPEKRKVIHEHMVSTLPKLIPPYNNLMTYLQSQESRMAVAAMISDVLAQIESYGHEQAVQQLQTTNAA